MRIYHIELYSVILSAVCYILHCPPSHRILRLERQGKFFPRWTFLDESQYIREFWGQRVVPSVRFNAGNMLLYDKDHLWMKCVEESSLSGKKMTLIFYRSPSCTCCWVTDGGQRPLTNHSLMATLWCESLFILKIKFLLLQRKHPDWRIPTPSQWKRREPPLPVMNVTTIYRF